MNKCYSLSIHITTILNCILKYLMKPTHKRVFQALWKIDWTSIRLQTLKSWYLYINVTITVNLIFLMCKCIETWQKFMSRLLYSYIFMQWNSFKTYWIKSAMFFLVRQCYIKTIIKKMIDVIHFFKIQFIKYVYNN